MFLESLDLEIDQACRAGDAEESTKADAEGHGDRRTGEPAADADRDDPLAEARDALWERFDQADGDERFRLFGNAIDQPGLIDRELGFDCLDLLATDARSAGDHARLVALLERIERQCPDVDASEKTFILEWWIDSARAAGLRDQFALAARRRAEVADDAFHRFQGLLDQTAFDGNLPLLLDLYRIAGPVVRANPDPYDWIIKSAYEEALAYEVLDVSLNTVSPDDRTARLGERMALYGPNIGEPDLIDQLARFASHLVGDHPGS